MPKLEFKGREVYRHEVENLVDKDKAKEVLDLLFGDRCDDCRSDFTIKNRFADLPKSTALQRFNLLWVFPVFFLIVAPFRYIKYGNHQVSSGTKFASVLTYLLGEDWK